MVGRRRLSPGWLTPARFEQHPFASNEAALSSPVPRFLLVAGVARDGLSRPAWPDIDSRLLGATATDGSWISWRLTGANHRELGRAVRVFPDSIGVQESINEVRVGVDAIERVVLASPRDGRWTWRAGLAGTIVATSGRPYARHRECVYNLEAFLAAVPLAQIATTSGRRSGGPPPAVPDPRVIADAPEYAG